jgi:hypothetical protein
MLLTPQNSTNPKFWGKEITYTPKGMAIGEFKVKVPDGFDFINALFPKDPSQAKQYFNGYNK